MKKESNFNVGDKVFAKVKGYPAWPAIVMEDHKTKYSVKFYGTGETGSVKGKDLLYYLKSKDKFVKYLKRKDYNDAIEEIEKAIEECGGTDGSSQDSNNESTASFNSTLDNGADSSKTNKRKRSVSTDKLSDSRLKKRPVSSVGSDSSSNMNDSDTKIEEKDIESPTNESKSDELEESGDLEHSPHKDKKKPNRRGSEKIDPVRNVPNKDEISLAGKRDVNTSPSEKNKLQAEQTNHVPAVVALDVKIVPDSRLQALLKYADHVKKNEEMYRSKSVESRRKSRNEIVMAKLPNGTYIGIKYNRDTPPPCENEYEMAEYELEEANTILSLKSLLEDGKCDPKEDPNLFEMDLNLEEQQIQKIIDRDLLEGKRERLKWLERENTLLEIDMKIKGCLQLDKAEPNIAITCLTELMQLDIHPLMLKKHPHVVDMVKRLRRYTGNVKDWNFTTAEDDNFAVSAEEIRDKAEDLYDSFAQLFGLPEANLDFWDIFTTAVSELRDHLENMKEAEVMCLVCEPCSRQAFLNEVDDQEEIKTVASRMERKTPVSSITAENVVEGSAKAPSIISGKKQHQLLSTS